MNENTLTDSQLRRFRIAVKSWLPYLTVLIMLSTVMLHFTLLAVKVTSGRAPGHEIPSSPLGSAAAGVSGRPRDYAFTHSNFQRSICSFLNPRLSQIVCSVFDE